MARSLRLLVGSAGAIVAAACTLVTDLDGFSTGASGTDAGLDAATESGPSDATADTDANDGPMPTDPYTAAVLADSPRVYLKLEGTEGTTAKDERGVAAGTLTVGCQRGAAGRGGRGVLLDGSKCRISLGNVLPFTGNAPFSVELWFRPTQVTSQVRFLIDRASKSDGGSGYSMYFSDTFFLTSRGGATATDGYAAGPVPKVSAFAHVVFAYDGNTVQLYTNGMRSDSTASVEKIIDYQDAELVFGDSARGQFYRFVGTIDEIAIYDRALDASRVKVHFEAAP